jgi:hypothetical protein
MPRYLFLVRRDGQPGPLTSAKRRGTRLRKLEVLATSLEGKIETFDSPFGDVDLYTVCDLPTNIAAARFASVLRGEHHRPVHTVLLPPPPRNSFAYDQELRDEAMNVVSLLQVANARETHPVTN